MSAIARFGVLLCLLAPFANAAVAAEERWTGRPIVEILDELAADGLPIVYSTALVRDDYIVASEPAGEDDRERLAAALAVWNLALADGPGDSLLIVRGGRATMRAEDPGEAAVEPPRLEEVVVTSSRYDLRYRSTAVHTFLDRELTAALPDIGDEPLRALWRLPGTASGGVSARHHVRGGERNEQLFLLDGIRLYEPYHLKDFHQVATIVDQNAIAGIDFYSGGYPAEYGDRMSGVIAIDLREPPVERETEIGLSLFNASLLSAGRFGGHDRGDWLLSARRGNLDIVADLVDPSWGSPRYEDVLARVGWDLGARTRLIAGWLYSFDRISIADPGAGEQARAKYRNSIGWLRVATEFTGNLAGELTASLTDIGNERSGSRNVPGTLDGTVEDRRDFRASSLTGRLEWQPTDGWAVTAGLDARRLEAGYRYSLERSIAPPFAAIFDNEPATVRSLAAEPSGSQYAAWADVRWQPVEKLVVNGGLRWDQQTYTTAADDRQLSPRLSLLYRLAPGTDLRLAGGQFYQAQEINELQVSDGLTTFFPAQRARHLVVGLEQRLPGNLELRVEAYEKRYHSLAPRFENLFDPLVLVPELHVDRVRMNAREALARGIELTLTGGGQQLQWWAGYVRAKVEDITAEGRVPRSWDQRHTFKAGLDWDRQPWHLGVAAIVHSGWPRTTLAGSPATNPDGSRSLALAVGPRNGDRHAPFRSLDVRVSRKLPVTKGELDVFMEISNLLDRRNPCCTAYSLATDDDGTPRLEAEEREWLPLVPSVGVLWRF